MKKQLFFLAMVLSAFFACRDEDDDSGIAYADYTNLQVGNYWIYERYSLDTNGVYTSLNAFDTVFVEKDTLINGRTYFKLMGPDPYMNINQPNRKIVASYIRDSLHYVVDHTGAVMLSSLNFTDTLFWRFDVDLHPPVPDTLVVVFDRMTDQNESASTPAGQFSTINNLRTIRFTKGWGPDQHMNRRYARDVGLVLEDLYAWISDPAKLVFGRRLVSYGQY